MSDGVEVHVGWTGHTRIDFDKKKIRKVMRARGRDIQKEARRLVARRAVSAPGEYPGRDTGTLWRSIKSKVSRSGFLVRIAPQKTPEMGGDFYPAFLWYGVRRKGGDEGSAWRIDPRANYMTEALDRRREVSQSTIKAALQDALIPR
ncbi:hypothetical protein AWB70_01058 [Caballeronia cordobensis]|uniref:HK97 gp10 family phage protein n=1 Tax=Caballeronia cordobensis TaxID=1353886 RepID=A0A158FLV1_CABCO|nr:hypothetical protein [Caballeronia cordobensis]SAL20667.1 hypothetical protein AWB70_01058 [Caballeronia cordobensis]